MYNFISASAKSGSVSANHGQSICAVNNGKPQVSAAGYY